VEQQVSGGAKGGGRFPPPRQKKLIKEGKNENGTIGAALKL